MTSQVQNLAKALAQGDPNTTLRIGTVTGINGVRVQTDQTDTAWLNRSQDMTVSIGDRVWMLQQGTTFLVAGRLNGAQMSAPGIRRKLTFQSVTSSTTVIDDADMNVQLTPGTYRVELLAHYSSMSSLPNIRSQWSFSGTYSPIGRSCVGPGTASTANDGSSTSSVTRSSGHAFTTAVSYGTDGTGTAAVLREDLSLIVLTSGLFQWQWAQNTSNATAVNVSLASRLYVTPLQSL